MARMATSEALLRALIAQALTRQEAEGWVHTWHQDTAGFVVTADNEDGDEETREIPLTGFEGAIQGVDLAEARGEYEWLARAFNDAPSACTGYRDSADDLQHDGDTCPVHEPTGRGPRRLLRLTVEMPLVDEAGKPLTFREARDLLHTLADRLNGAADEPLHTQHHDGPRGVVEGRAWIGVTREERSANH